MSVWVCVERENVYVWEREREKERESGREREREWIHLKNKEETNKIDRCIVNECTVKRKIRNELDIYIDR